MGSKLYVGNLSYSTTEETLRAVFEGDGREVQNVSIILDRETGRSRGFAFVQMASDDQAQEAIRALDGYDVDGRSLRVKEAREREQRSNSGSSRPPSRGGQVRRSNDTAARSYDDRPSRPPPSRPEFRSEGYAPRAPAPPPDWNEPNLGAADGGRGRGSRGGRNRRESERDRDTDQDFDRKRGGRDSRGRNRDWKRDWEI